MKTIKLTQNQVALVSDEDYDFLNQWKWYAKKSGANSFIAMRGEKESGKRKTICMHRVICPGEVIDHKDGNSLNNTRENLRSCTSNQSHQNRQRTKGSSQYRGVSWSKKNRKWIGRVKNDRRSIYLGSFADEEQAARAYDKTAREVYGEFARLNFPLNEDI